jgi:hypothetical protein
MTVWKQVSLLAGWFLFLGAGLIVRDILILADPDPAFGAPVFVALLGLAGLEFSRRKIEGESGEVRSWMQHSAAPIVFGLPCAIAAIWLITVRG